MASRALWARVCLWAAATALLNLPVPSAGQTSTLDPAQEASPFGPLPFSLPHGP